MGGEATLSGDSGYRACACRDCMEIAIGEGKRPAYCHACESAGCPDYQGMRGMSQECQVDNAYGEDEETEE